MYIPIMPARSVQISLDDDLLEEVDSRPEAKRDGRSAVIKRALRLYLDRRQQESIDESYARAYGGRRRARTAHEFEALLDAQAWPDEP